MARGLCGAYLAVCMVPAAFAQAARPMVGSKSDAAGAIFAAPGAKTESRGEHSTIANIMMKSNDQKMEAGMYKPGASYFEVKDHDYGLDEFMLFTSGSVARISLDGHVTRLKAGDAVIFPTEWRGTWARPATANIA